MMISKKSFKFSLFKRVYMFNEKSMGIVIEKEDHVVCVYGTDENHKHIYCAVPLCAPKYLRGMEYTIRFFDDDVASVVVDDMRIVINFNLKKCSNNFDVHNYGSDTWGNNVAEEWSESFSALFEG